MNKLVCTCMYTHAHARTHSFVGFLILSSFFFLFKLERVKQAMESYDRPAWSRELGKRSQKEVDDYVANQFDWDQKSKKKKIKILFSSTGAPVTALLPFSEVLLFCAASFFVCNAHSSHKMYSKCDVQSPIIRTRCDIAYEFDCDVAAPAPKLKSGKSSINCN